MLRVEYTRRSDNAVRRAPGALVRLSNAEEEVHCLVAPFAALPFNNRSSLCRVSLYAPGGQVASVETGGIYNWARLVWGEEDRGFTLVELTAPAVHALLAAGATSRAVATVAEGMCAIRVHDSGGALAENSVTINRVGDETLELSDSVWGDVLLVGEDGSLLGITSGDSDGTLYSFEEIANEFLEERTMGGEVEPDPESLHTLHYSRIR